MGLPNVVDHEHFFPSNRPWDSDDEDHRFDTCVLKDGRIVVYSSDKREIVVDNLPSVEKANEIAQRLADESAGLLNSHPPRTS